MHFDFCLNHGSFLHCLSYFTLYCNICLCISNAAHLPRTNETMQKVKTWYICPAIPPPCQGIGCVVKTGWYTLLLGESSLAAES